VSATVAVPRLGRRKATTYRLKALTRSIVKGASGKRKIALRLSVTATGAIRRTLKAGRRIVVAFRIVVADLAANKRTITRSVRLTA
jgi:hypothetical protein